MIVLRRCLERLLGVACFKAQGELAYGGGE